MTLIRWQPREALRLRREVDDLMRTFCGEWGNGNGSDAAWQPRVDVSEAEDGFTVHADLPGVNREDVKVTLHEGVLTIEGEKRRASEEKERGYSWTERAYGRFHRSFSLSQEVDAGRISAAFKDGVLTLALPKAEVVRPKEIEVKVA